MDPGGRAAEDVSLDSGPGGHDCVRWDPLVHCEAEVVDVELEEEVLDDLNGVVRYLELDDALAGVLLQSHHRSMHLDSSHLLLVASLRLLDDWLEWSRHERGAHDRPLHAGIATGTATH